MNKICFIMPIYPPHFDYANAFVCSFFRFGFESQADLAFVFTDKNEAQIFKHTNFKGYYHSLILPKFLRTSRDNGIINIKKFYALKKLHKFYDYIIIIDSESELRKNVNLYALCERFYKQKYLFGNETLCDASKIKNESKKFFAPHCTTREIHNDNLYFWFNQPCIYKCAFITEFFHKANLTKMSDLLKLNFFTFDFYVYGYFLLLYKDFSIQNVEIRAEWGFLELTDFSPQSDKFKQFCFYQCNFYLLTRLKQDDLFLIIQKDKQKKSLQELQTQIMAYYFGFILARYGGAILGQVRCFFMLGTLKRVRKIQNNAFYNALLANESYAQNVSKILQDYIDSLHLSETLAYKLGIAFFSVIDNANAYRGGGSAKSAHINFSNRLNFCAYVNLYFMIQGAFLNLIKKEVKNENL